MTACLLVGMMVVPSAAAVDTQMYLYNGIELPALPEYDTSVYSHASINYYPENPDASKYVLEVYSIPCQYIDTEQGVIVCVPAGTGWMAMIYYCDVSKSGWTFNSASSDSGYNYVVDNLRSEQNIFWTNTDIPNTIDGGVFLAASNPVLVDETSSDLVLSIASVNYDSYSIRTTFAVSGGSADALYSITASCFSGVQVVGSSAVGPYSGPGFQTTVSVGGLSPSTEYTVEYQLSKDGEYTGVSQTVTVTTAVASGSGFGDGAGNGTGDSGSCACPSILNSVLSAITTQTNFLSTWQQAWATRMDSLESTLSRLISVPDPTETALKESVKDTTKEVTDSLFADDAPTKVTASDVKDVAQIGAAASSMFDSGVSVGSFFDTLNDLRFIAFFSQATYDDLNTVPSVSTYSRGEQNGYVDYYSDNLNKIQKFAGGG